MMIGLLSPSFSRRIARALSILYGPINTPVHPRRGRALRARANYRRFKNIVPSLIQRPRSRARSPLSYCFPILSLDHNFRATPYICVRTREFVLLKARKRRTASVGVGRTRYYHALQAREKGARERESPRCIKSLSLSLASSFLF